MRIIECVHKQGCAFTLEIKVAIKVELIFLKSEKMRKFMSECSVGMILKEERANQTNVRSIDCILPAISEKGMMKTYLLNERKKKKPEKKTDLLSMWLEDSCYHCRSMIRL